MEIEEFLSKLKKVKKTGLNQWQALCPAHDDHSASLSVKLTDDRILLKCFAGCTSEDIVNALGLNMKDLYVSLYPPKQLHTCTDEPKTKQKQHLRLVQFKKGDLHTCTLEDYAKEKKLPLSFLKGLGVSDVKYKGNTKICIPYYNETHEEIARRYRSKGANGEKIVSWRTGDKTLLYGLWQIDNKQNHLVICEGESDSQTLWFHGIPAIGLPGASNWRDARDAHYFDDIEKIYILREPDAGGEAVEKWLAQSSIRDRAYIVRLDGFKDPSELHIADPENFKTNFQKALDESIPWIEIERERREALRKEAWQGCFGLARQNHILKIFTNHLAECGLVGEDKPAQILFLALISRLFDKPTNIIVDGPSSGGKSFLLDTVLKFFPTSSYHELSGMSDRNLAYTEEPLSHRFLVLLEASGITGDFGTYLIRSILSEGHIRYEYVDKGNEGLESKLIEKEGPTGLIMTTTKVWIHAENETRMLRITINDTREQTQNVFLALANETPEVDFKPWHALQEWLAGGENRVVIPFASDIARLTKPLAVRLRRDFSSFLSLIKAHALLYQYNRERDSQGRIIAELRDYEVVLDLVNDIISEGIAATIRNSIRETVKATDEAIKLSNTNYATIKEISDHLDLDRSATARRVQTAVRYGFLKHYEDNRRSKAHKIIVGDPLPEDQNIFPTIDQLHTAHITAQVKNE